MTAATRSDTDAEGLLTDAVERLLVRTCTSEALAEAERDGWSAPVWDALAGGGFPWIGVPEAAGGSGGSMSQAMVLLDSIGRHAAPVPVAETGVLGGWLLAAAGLELPAGPTTVVPDPDALALSDGIVRGAAVVAWARRSERICALVAGGDGPLIVSARPGQLTITAGTNLAGEPRDEVRFDVPLREVESAPAPGDVDGEALRARGALTRVVLIAGALASLLDLSVRYTRQRHQFGRPIASFQAVQHHLVTLAEARVRAAAAADLAIRAAASGGGRFEVAVAKVIADEAVVESTRAGHQAHGAIGLTREYPLHHFSRRLWAWRHEYGTARTWRRYLGAQVVAAGPDDLFPLIAR